MLLFPYTILFLFLLALFPGWGRVYVRIPLIGSGLSSLAGRIWSRVDVFYCLTWLAIYVVLYLMFRVLIWRAAVRFTPDPSGVSKAEQWVDRLMLARDLPYLSLVVYLMVLFLVVLFIVFGWINARLLLSALLVVGAIYNYSKEAERLERKILRENVN